MKYIKIQTDLMKVMDKQQTYSVRYQEDEENVYLTTDGLRIFIIPQWKFFIDLKKIVSSYADVKKLLKPKDADIAQFKGEIRKLTNGKTVRKIEAGEKYAYLDEKLLKEFGEITGYKMTNEKSLVYLYAGDELLGGCLPAWVRKEDEI